MLGSIWISFENSCLARSATSGPTSGRDGRPGAALGAAAGYLNFRWLKRLVDSLDEAARGKPPKARVAVFLGLRYLLLAAGGYVILNFSSLSLAAALIGLFVPAAAVVLEILFELIYAGT